MDTLKDKAKDTAKDAAKETAKDKVKDAITDKIPEGFKSMKHRAESMVGIGGDGGGDNNNNRNNRNKSGDRYKLDYKSFGWSLLAGGAAAGLGKTVVAPIDMMSPTPHETSVATQQGYMTYWRGNLSNVVRAFPNEGLNFALRDYYNGMLGIRDIDARREPWKYFWMTYTGGGLAGVVSLTLLYPIDAAYGSRLPTGISETLSKELHLKGGSTREISSKYDIGKVGKIDPVQAGRETMNMAKDAAKGFKDTAKDMGQNLKENLKETAQDVGKKVQDVGHKVKETAQEVGHKVREGHLPVSAKPEGLFGVYRGFVPSVMGAFVYRAAYFGAYDTVRAMYPEKSSFLWTWLIAQTTTTASGFLAHPFDVIRYRMMHNRHSYSSTWNCWAKTCGREGMSALYRGSSANMVRSTGGALTLVFYDQIKKYMGNMKMV